MRLSRLALGATGLGHLALVGGLMTWAGAPVGALLALPLLATVPGLLRGRSYTAGWASMLLVFYMALLLAEGVANPMRRTIAQALACVAAFDFTALVLFVRLAARERAAPGSRTESSGGAAR